MNPTSPLMDWDLLDWWGKENYFGGISSFLSSLIDPPKATVPNAVEQCRSAGISVRQVQILSEIYIYI